VTAVLGSARPDALLAVSADPAAARAWLVEVAAGLPVLSLPADAERDEVALVIGALTGAFETAGDAGAAAADVEAAGASVVPLHAWVEVESELPESRIEGGASSDESAGVAPEAPRAVAEQPGAAEEPPVVDPVAAAIPEVGTALQASPESALILAKLEEVRSGSYFDVLGLEPGATSQAVHARYETLARAFSAERFEGRVGATFEEHLREIGRGLFDAVYVLGDDDLRARYAAALDGRSRRALM
jgi:hypothetical protein